jgi:hypothetical protein
MSWHKGLNEKEARLPGSGNNGNQSSIRIGPTSINNVIACNDFTQL